MVKKTWREFRACRNQDFLILPADPISQYLRAPSDSADDSNKLQSSVGWSWDLPERASEHWNRHRNNRTYKNWLNFDIWLACWLKWISVSSKLQGSFGRSWDLPETASELWIRHRKERNHENQWQWIQMAWNALTIRPFEAHSHFPSFPNHPKP